MTTSERSLALVGGVLGGLLAATLGVPAAMAVESAAQRRNRNRARALQPTATPRPDASLGSPVSVST